VSSCGWSASPSRSGSATPRSGTCSGLRLAIETQASTGGDDHQLLIEALRHRDVPQATSLMERHILARGDSLIELLEQRGRWEEEASDPQQSAS
jgi:DNA-binding FadR family transcriptional regulator